MHRWYWQHYFSPFLSAEMLHMWYLKLLRLEILNTRQDICKRYDCCFFHSRENNTLTLQLLCIFLCLEIMSKEANSGVVHDFMCQIICCGEGLTKVWRSMQRWWLCLCDWWRIWKISMHSCYASLQCLMQAENAFHWRLTKLTLDTVTIPFYPPKPYPYVIIWTQNSGFFFLTISHDGIDVKGDAVLLAAILPISITDLRPESHCIKQMEKKRKSM